MTRDELIAYLELKAHAFEGHPFHSDMSEALRGARWDVIRLRQILKDEGIEDIPHPGPHPQSTGFCQYED
jgi:hypothetical protein